MNVTFIRCKNVDATRWPDTPKLALPGRQPRRTVASESRWHARCETPECCIRCNCRGLFNNTLLIWVQHAAAYAQGRVPDPHPTFVAGFKQWQALGRHVMKGQPGYQILAPVTARMASYQPDSWRRLGRGEKPASGEVVRSRMVGVRPAYVWAQSQTNGKPLPETPMPKLLEGQAPPGLWDGLADLITAHGFELRLVSNAAAIGGANGLTDYLTHEVAVRAWTTQPRSKRWPTIY